MPKVEIESNNHPSKEREQKKKHQLPDGIRTPNRQVMQCLAKREKGHDN
jgi:hypothetical protein